MVFHGSGNDPTKTFTILTFYLLTSKPGPGIWGISAQAFSPVCSGLLCPDEVVAKKATPLMAQLSHNSPVRTREEQTQGDSGKSTCVGGIRIGPRDSNVGLEGA